MRWKEGNEMSSNFTAYVLGNIQETSRARELEEK